jgi:hypothetical protein
MNTDKHRWYVNNKDKNIKTIFSRRERREHRAKSKFEHFPSNKKLMNELNIRINPMVCQGIYNL